MTFHTHKGHLKCLRIQFGVKMPQDVFHIKKDMIIKKCFWMTAIHNDITVHGKDKVDHDPIPFLTLMNVAAKNGLVFNSSKCKIKGTSIILYHYQFPDSGIQPDPTRAMRSWQHQFQMTSLWYRHFLASTSSYNHSYLTCPFTQWPLDRLQQNYTFYCDASIKTFADSENHKHSRPFHDHLLNSITESQ